MFNLLEKHRPMMGMRGGGGGGDDGGGGGGGGGMGGAVTFTPMHPLHQAW